MLVAITQFGVETNGGHLSAVLKRQTGGHHTTTYNATQNNTVSARTCTQSHHIELDFPVSDNLLDTLNFPDAVNSTQRERAHVNKPETDFKTRVKLWIRKHHFKATLCRSVLIESTAFSVRLLTAVNLYGS